MSKILNWRGWTSRDTPVPTEKFWPLGWDALFRCWRYREVPGFPGPTCLLSTISCGSAVPVSFVLSPSRVYSKGGLSWNTQVWVGLRQRCIWTTKHFLLCVGAAKADVIKIQALLLPIKAVLVIQVGISLTKTGPALLRYRNWKLNVSGCLLSSGSGSQVSEMSFADFKWWFVLRRLYSLPHFLLVHVYTRLQSGNLLRRKAVGKDCLEPESCGIWDEVFV